MIFKERNRQCLFLIQLQLEPDAPDSMKKMSSEGPFRKGKKAMFNAVSVNQRTKPDETAVQGATKN